MIESEVAPPVIEAAKPASSDLAPGGLRAPQPVARKGAARAWLPFVALLAAVMGLHLATLLRFPAPFVDEGWNASRAWGLLHTGQAFGTLDAGLFDKYPGYWTYFPWLATAVHTLFMAV